MGGSIESFHFAFGKNDAYVIAESQRRRAAAVAMAVNAAGAGYCQVGSPSRPSRLTRNSEDRGVPPTRSIATTPRVTLVLAPTWIVTHRLHSSTWRNRR